MKIIMGMSEIFRKIKYTMRFSILTVFITLFVTAILIITIIVYFRFSQSISNVAFNFMNQVAFFIYDNVEMEINNISAEIEMFNLMVKQGILRTDDAKNIIDYLNVLIRPQRQITISLQGIYFADETGSFYMARQSSKDVIETEIINRKKKPYQHIFIYRNPEGKIIKIFNSSNFDYDPRIRPWYVLAKKEKKLSWTDIYRYHLTGDLGITAAKPIYSDNGELKGIIAFNLRLDYIRRFIESLHISPNGITYLVTLKGKILAFPHLPQYQAERLINIQELKVPWVIASFEEYQKKRLNQFQFRYAGERYLAMYRRLPKFLSDRGWMIGMVAPEQDFISELKKTNFIALLTSLIVLLVGIYLMSKLVSRIVSPLKKVVHETEKIRNFQLDTLPPRESQIKEINTLFQAIYRMKQGLRSFEKYVPTDLVRLLIGSGHDVLIGGERKQLAVFFSDIENFTTISESMDPDKLMEYICEYFNAISPIIVKAHGTIDKYIGDSVMAFWGAPLPENKPCHLAASAALDCIKRLNVLNMKWIAEGKIPLNTRIGLHFGEAIVGNLGSNERLNYTAIGDVINTTNRLEAANKFYHTKIIVSDHFYHEVAEDFTLRLIDFIALRGRVHGNYIYELLSKNKEELSFNLTEYQNVFAEGFNAYQQKNWDLAISKFQSCLQLYPADTIAPIFITRCQYLMINPPSHDWNGIWRIQS